MKIHRAEGWRRQIPLREPYTIASGTFDRCDLGFVRLVAEDGTEGLGSASAGERVTGETADATAAAFADLTWLEGLDPRQLGACLRVTEEALSATPAARAAVDMALHDLHSRWLGIPLVDLLGRRRAPLPTSVTLGIADEASTLALAERWWAEGFRCFKVKVGRDPDTDTARLARLRERFDGARLRVDANEGFDLATVQTLVSWVERLGVELVEQPLPRTDIVTDAATLRRLPAALRAKIAVDESLLGVAEAVTLAAPEPACGIFNIKLMKCGGLAPALAIAGIAETTGIELMWGCMDESRISITAALHAALASPATRYLDLDGSFDLAADPAVGGFRCHRGMLLPVDAPGLGVTLAEATE